MKRPSTLVEMLEQRGKEAGRPFLTIVDPHGHEQTFSTQELWHGALASGAALRAQGLKPGDRLMLLLPNGLSFVSTLFGALVSGIVPVIYPPPHTARVLRRYLGQLERIIEQCRPWGAVVDETTLAVATGFAIEGLKLIGPPLTDATLPGIYRPKPEDPAIIQYSSGSTGDPKGVVLSHRAILSNGFAVGQALEGNESDVVLSWLPLCHDMGLFGSLLFPWQLRWRTIHMQPHHFLVDPVSWLRQLTRHRATITVAPNFAYSLCLHGIEDEALDGLDLSNVRACVNGAEPISRRAVDGFLNRFGPKGFARGALFPVYGMAENTLANAFPPLGRGPQFDRIRRSTLEHEGRAVPISTGNGSSDDADVKEIATVGTAISGVELCILDEKDERVPERVEGQICLRGTSLMSAYLNNPTATETAMRGGWLHTGDRGYFADGELYVTGRESDLIIRAGRNLHPQDFETLIDPIEGLRRGCVVAGGVRDAEDSTEEIVILAETKIPATNVEELLALRRKIRDVVLETLGVSPEQIVLLEPRSLPKTSSGKLQRRLALRLLASGELQPLGG